MEEDYRKMKHGKERLYLEERSLVDMALKLISLTNIICCYGTVILSRSREGAGEYYVQKGHILRLQEYEKVGNSSWSLQRPKRTNSCILWLWENQENVLVFRFILSLKTMHLQVQTSKLSSMEGVPYVNERYIFCKNWYVNGGSPYKTLLRWRDFYLHLFVQKKT